MGYADIIVSGGSEAAITIAGIGGFNSMHALSTNNSPDFFRILYHAIRKKFIFLPILGTHPTDNSVWGCAKEHATPPNLRDPPPLVPTDKI